jgi:hypothetical protein
MVHASPGGSDERLTHGTPEQRLRELGSCANADIVMIGHSHIPMVRTVNGTVFINPGSVGQPRDDDPRASYALLDTSDFHVEIHRVDHNGEINARPEIEKIRPMGDLRIRKDETTALELNTITRSRSTMATSRLSTMEEIANRLNLDHDHSLQVRKLAIRLFEDLTLVHKLKAKDLFLLEVGCLLHDIGVVEGAKGHHKTSYRMIMDSHELPLSEEEQRIVALLALYHRKKPPQVDAPSLSILTSGERVRVRKLAALLRIADGLDYRHVGAVSDLQGRVESDKVTLTLLGADSALAEKEKALKKADLFEQVFKRDLVIE